jgi:hypothetical protein
MPSPACGRFGRLRENARAVDQEQRPAIDSDVARVAQDRLHDADEFEVGLRVVALRDQHLVVRSIPSAGPVLVRPAEAERVVERGIVEDLLQRTIEQLGAGEPIVVLAKAVDPVVLGDLDLPSLHVGDSQVVEPSSPGKWG